MNSVLSILKKDFLILFGNKGHLFLFLVFPLSTLFTAAYVLQPYTIETHLYTTILWIVIYITSLSATVYTFSYEIDGGTYQFLLISHSLYSIYSAKLLINALSILAIGTVSFLSSQIFFDKSFVHFHFEIILLLLGTISLTSLLTLTGLLSALVGGKSLTAGITAAPFTLPILATLIHSHISLIQNNNISFNSSVFLLSFSLLIISLSAIWFKKVWEAPF